MKQIKNISEMSIVELREFNSLLSAPHVTVPTKKDAFYRLIFIKISKNSSMVFRFDEIKKVSTKSGGIKMKYFGQKDNDKYYSII